jgi:glycosyltransferase involved in cell wall biosynthesis
MPQLSLSVIIPTYQREAVLRDTLKSVLQQGYPDFEVIVVDQTPVHKPETQALLERLAAEGQITLYRVNWASLPAARNYAIERCRGDIVVFIDDDVELPPGFLQAHACNYGQRPEVGAVAGRVFDRMKLAESDGRVIEDLPPKAMDPGIGWYYVDLVNTVKAQQVITARGCNMSFRRAVFDQFGLRFDERFYGSAVREESDFCLRMRQTGLMIWYDPAAHLVHLGEATGGCHDIGPRSLRYQLHFYHNHFLMGLKNLTLLEVVRLGVRLFDCHVLGNPPCNKDRNLGKVVIRGVFYLLGFGYACLTLLTTLGRQGRLYTS